MTTHLLGIDLAWKGHNSTGIAVGEVQNNQLQVVELASTTLSLEQLLSQVKRWQPVGIAIDAPLIIPNQTGQRDCERLVGRRYGHKGASCHTSNLDLYPDAISVQLSRKLATDGYAHQQGGRWQIECYPHPALIEVFGLAYRLAYKKGLAENKRAGQIQLARHLLSLESHPHLPMRIPPAYADYVRPEVIQTLKGTALKQNEDRLDTLVCLYIAFRHHQGLSLSFGTEEQGYIVI
ncbi:DUF429 domain-containing protein [Pseudaeromonas sp. ZJS20]|uniref:DUF429 domain-containing protein n=1 Tax=Pseudaeromonas aegiceratis TaxID=3153928 RepID=UPI00390C446E